MASDPQWAVLRADDDALYSDEATARRDLACMDEDGEDGFVLYLVTPVVAAPADDAAAGEVNLWFTRPAEFPLEVAERADRAAGDRL